MKSMVLTSLGKTTYQKCRLLSHSGWMQRHANRCAGYYTGEDAELTDVQIFAGLSNLNLWP